MKNNTKYEIGVSTNCECGDTFEETLRNIKAAGFRNVMISEKSGGTLEDNVKKAQDLGLNIPYIHLAYRLPYGNCMNDMWTSGEENRAFIESLINRLSICHKYGIKTVVMHPTYNPTKSDKSEWSDARGIETMKEILKTASKFGIKIAFENLNPSDNIYLSCLLDNIDSPWLGFCYDCGHHQLYTAEVDFLELYGNRCFAVHLHDNLMDAEDKNQCMRDLHYLPFDGKIDFTVVMKKIADSSYNNVIMLELHKSDYYNIPYERYSHLNSVQYLKEAYKRGEKLAEMIEKARQV